MKHAFVMSPLATVKAHKDTTYFLMRACVARGHQVCYCDPRGLFLRQHELFARVCWLRVNEDIEHPFDIVGEETLPLAQMQAVWIRTDPPFDRRYFYATLLLDFLPATTRVINRPSGIRNINEKLGALLLPELTPPTLICNDIAQLKAFAAEHGRITLKPIDGFAGRGIVFYSPGDDDAAFADLTKNESHLVIAQKYLPAAADGDKRILLLDGEPLGAILRVHAEGSELNNLDAGGSAHPAKLDARDLEICAAIKPHLTAQGIFFAGIDVIGGKLIEVNVTSPTGLQELCRFEKTDFHHQIVEALE